MNKKNIVEFIKKNHKIMIAGAIAILLFNKYIVLITLFLLLAFVGLLSVKVTQVVPHISIETITASAVFFGYVFDWKLGLGFGLLVGFYSYAQISFVKLKAIINVLLMGLSGVVAAIFASLGYSFTLAYMLTFVVRIVLNNIIFPLIESDIFENMIHGFGDPLFNMLITYQFINVLYKVVIHMM